MALLAGASGQLRNLATTGGNLLQRTRCPYFRDLTTPATSASRFGLCRRRRLHPLPRHPRHLAALHRRPPSDMAVALAAFDAEVVILGTGASAASRSATCTSRRATGPTAKPAWRTVS
ncbi:FAD binding domain-containing protein [Streptomyces sp. M19]